MPHERRRRQPVPKPHLANRIGQIDLGIGFQRLAPTAPCDMIEDHARQSLGHIAIPRMSRRPDHQAVRDRLDDLRMSLDDGRMLRVKGR